MVLGAYPTITLQKARVLREQARALLAKSIDPKEQAEQEKTDVLNETQNTFKYVAEQRFDVKRASVSEGWEVHKARGFN